MIIGGDFNAKAIDWGMPKTDSRGRRILEMAARFGVTVGNEGSTSTFRRPGCKGTIPDITMTRDNTASSLRNWKVMEDFTGSDHQYILFNVAEDREGQSQNNWPRWNLNKLDKDKFLTAIATNKETVLKSKGNVDQTIGTAMKLIKSACDIAMPRKKDISQRKKRSTGGMMK